MNIRSEIQNVISSNISNINTPGYKCKSINFQNELNRIINKEETIDLTTTNKKHFKIKPEKIDGYTPMVKTCKNNIYGNDKNNVDLDKEMAKMSKNHLLYNADSQIIGKEFKILRDVIIQGGK